MELALSANTHSTKQSSTQRRSLVGYVINTAKVFLSFFLLFLPFACEWERATAQIQTTVAIDNSPIFPFFFFLCCDCVMAGRYTWHAAGSRQAKTANNIDMIYLSSLQVGCCRLGAISSTAIPIAREICCWMRPSSSCWLLISYCIFWEDSRARVFLPQWFVTAFRKKKKEN